MSAMPPPTGPAHHDLPPPHDHQTAVDSPAVASTTAPSPAVWEIPTSAPWRRVSPISMATAGLSNAGPLVAVLVAVTLFGREQPQWIWYALFGVVATVLGNVVAVLRTRYRLSDGVLEMQTGLFSLTHSKARVKLIRSVRVEQKALERVFGLASLKVETASDTESFSVEGITVQNARQINAQISEAIAARDRQSHATDAAAAHHTASLAAPPHDEPVDLPPPPLEKTSAAPFTSVTVVKAKINWIWRSSIGGNGFIPFVAIAGVLFGFFDNVFNLQDTIWNYLTRSDIFERSAEQLDGMAVSSGRLMLLGVVVIGLILLGALFYLGNVMTYVWFNHKWTIRQTSPTHLETTRGLLSRINQTIDLDRVHGVRTQQSFLDRRVQVGTLDALLTQGLLAAIAGSNTALLPRAPWDAVHHVSAYVLGRDDLLTVPLTPHGPRAARRILMRAVMYGAVGFGAAAVAVWSLSLSWWWLVLPVALAVLNLVSAWLFYRHLGHHYVDDYLVIRSGSWTTERQHVHTSAAYGLHWSQSLFQRRLGLVTLSLPSAAGQFQIKEVDRQKSLDIAAHVDYELLKPFLADDEPTDIPTNPSQEVTS